MTKLVNLTEFLQDTSGEEAEKLEFIIAVLLVAQTASCKVHLNWEILTLEASRVYNCW